MATKVHMEALSPTMEEGQLVRWLKKEGDQVIEGDVLAEIETDKATMELVARGSGVLQKLMLAEGGTAPVGAVIGMIGEAGEESSSASAKQPETKEAEAKQAEAKQPEAKQPEAKQPEAKQAEAKQPAAKQPAAQSETEEHQQSDGGSQTSTEQGAGTDAWGRRKATGAKPSDEEKDAETAAAEPAAATASKTAPQEKAAPAEKGAPAEGNGQPEGRVKASPLARRLAAESGVELHSVQGTGPGGRITKRDIEAAGTSAPQDAPETEAEGEAEAETEAQPAAAKPGAQPAAPPVAAGGAEVQEVPVTQMRKAIAKRLVTSIGPVPTFYLTIEVDMTRTQEMRERLNARLKESGGKASVNDFIIRAAAEALRRHPEVNASWADTVIRRYSRVHVGVAVAIEDGLITPVIHDADRKGVAQIAAEVRELAGRAREKKLKPEEYTGATFSISNLGMFGIDEFTAIINPPESAILAVGRIEDKPVAEDGEVVVRPRMRVTMSCDHRVIDGATGAKFLQTLREFLEDPLMIIA